MSVLIFVVAVFLAIFIGQKTKANIGCIALAFAFVCGSFVWKIAPAKVINNFPIGTFFYMFIGAYFYGFAIDNGTFQNVANKILWKFRNNTKLMPVVLWATANLIGFLGAGNTAGPIFFSPIVFAIITEMGINPLIGAIIVFSGSLGGSNMPWTADLNGKIGMWDPLYGEQAYNVMVSYAVFQLIFTSIAFFVIFFIFKGYKGTQVKTVAAPEPMTRNQKLTLTIIGAMIALILIPTVVQSFWPNPTTKWMKSYLDIRLLGTVGALLCHLLKLGDINTVLKKRIPWNAILTVGGMGTLMGMAQSVGVADAISEFLTGSLPVWLVSPAIMICCGAMSLVVSGGVVQPMMMALIPGIVAVTGLNQYGLGIIIQFGLSIAGFSQFSTGGTMAVIGCTDEKTKGDLVIPMIICASLFVIIAAVLAGFGIFEAMGAAIGA